MIRRFVGTLLTGGVLLAGASPGLAAIIFSDNFSTSTLNNAAPATPTAGSTNHQVLATRDATGSSIAANSLKLNMINTSSGFVELQSLFATSPVNLTQTGQYIEARVAFLSAGLNLAGNSTLNLALLNSGGAGPVTGSQLNNGQLDDDPGSFNTGNAAGWLGYVGRIGRVGGASSQLYTRPAQTETSNEAQDALFNNAGGGAFDNPTATVIQGGGTGATFTNSTPYTLTMRATYDAGTSLITLNYNLSGGSGTITSLTGTTTVATTLTTGFDAFSIGYRGTDNQGPFSLDLSSLVIETNVVPEPSSLALLLFAACGNVLRRRSV